MSDLEDVGELVGDVSIGRFFAADIDLVVSVIVGFLIASQLAVFGQMAQGLSGFAFILLYYFLAEGLTATTPGKAVFGLSVRTKAGKRCDWNQALVRTLLRVIEVNPLLFGALPAGISILASKRKQRIGDRLAGTVVVTRRQLRQRETLYEQSQASATSTAE